MGANYGQAALISLNDTPLPPVGIVAHKITNQPILVAGDVQLPVLYKISTKKGSVTARRDLGPDLYKKLTWIGYVNTIYSCRNGFFNLKKPLCQLGDG